MSNVLSRCFSPSLVKTALAIGFLLPGAAQASLYLGILNLNGFQGSTVAISTNKIDFGTTSGPVVFQAPTGSGFTPLIGTTGTVKNIDNPPFATGVTNSLANFLTFDAAPNISFTLTVLEPGNLAPCNAVVCTPPNSPFDLVNTGGGNSTASFNVTGFETDSLTNTQVAFSGVFSATFTTPYQTVLNTVNGGGTIHTTYSASFITAATPEPSIFLPLGAGMIALFGARAFRKRSKV